MIIIIIIIAGITGQGQRVGKVSLAACVALLFLAVGM